MPTSFTNIYRKFLKMIDDYDLAKINDEELSEVLFGYLDEARSLYFPQCKKNLDDIIEADGLGEFVDELDSTEQHILALGMKKAWLGSKLNNADLMRKDIGDRDYKAVQGDGYLRALSNLEKEYDEYIRAYAVMYTYKDFSLEGW